MISNVTFFATLHNLFHSFYIMHAFQELVCYHRIHHSQTYYTVQNKTISFNFWTFNSTLKICNHVTKEDTEKSQYLWIKISFKWETLATKYHIYSITNFMANSLANKRLYSEFSF